MLDKQVRCLLKQQAELFATGDDGDYDIHGCAGGNIDDAFLLGQESGRTHMARQLCDMLDIAYRVGVE